jgi:hypothetical protein
MTPIPPQEFYRINISLPERDEQSDAARDKKRNSLRTEGVSCACAHRKCVDDWSD